MARRKSGGLTVPNLSKVEGSRVLFPEGEYRAKIAGVEPAEKKRGSDGGLWWKFEITEGKFEGKTIRMFTSFAEQALWNIKSLLDTIGYDIPDDDFDIDPDDVVERELVILIGHGEYNGRPQANVESFGPVDDEKPAKKGKAKSKSDDDEDEDEAPKKSRKSKAKAKDEDEDEDEDEKPKRGAKSKKKPADDEDEEEDEKPAKKGKKSKAKSKPTEDDINEMDQDELQAFIDENDELSELDLDDYKSLRKMKAAVIEMAQENDLLED